MTTTLTGRQIDLRRNIAAIIRDEILGPGNVPDLYAALAEPIAQIAEEYADDPLTDLRERLTARAIDLRDRQQRAYLAGDTHAEAELMEERRGIRLALAHLNEALRDRP